MRVIIILTWSRRRCIKKERKKNKVNKSHFVVQLLAAVAQTLARSALHQQIASVFLPCLAMRLLLFASVSFLLTKCFFFVRLPVAHIIILFIPVHFKYHMILFEEHYDHIVRCCIFWNARPRRSLLTMMTTTINGEGNEQRNNTHQN